MRWFGIGLALIGVVGALIAWFSFENIPFTIGGGVFVLIGLIVFIYSTRTLPK
jgi:peptidoglycan/LPS O-acetylase OafA/YrhL